MVSLMIGAAAMWYYSSFNLATDYTHYALARAFQGLGYGFFFVPVNVIAYSQLRPDQNNKASSLTNLFATGVEVSALRSSRLPRNVGGNSTRPIWEQRSVRLRSNSPHASEA